MLFSLSDRVIKEGRYVAQTGATVRATAKKFGVSKSCVHKDVTERLLFINEPLYKEVRSTLEKNFSEKHIRGGNATKLKYAKSSENLAKR